jgi:hypothetical protein
MRAVLLFLIGWPLSSSRIGSAFQAKPSFVSTFTRSTIRNRITGSVINNRSTTTTTSPLDFSINTDHRVWSSLTDTESSSSNNNNININSNLTLRDRLRRVTGFSLTVFRATLRGMTGISMTAVYASTVAATGLWIRKVTSVILSVFPSWFRYFLQPLLVLYYAPLFLLRNLTGPTRKRAKMKHITVLTAWKEAVEYAEKTEQEGYWPVVVNEDGYFEMVAPPNPDDITPAEANRQFSQAMAETVEHAMEVTEADRTNHFC